MNWTPLTRAPVGGGPLTFSEKDFTLGSRAHKLHVQVIRKAEPTDLQ